MANAAKPGHVAAGLTDDYIAIRIETEARQSLQNEIMTITAETGHADTLAFQILRPLDLWTRDDTMSQNILDRTDKDEIHAPCK